MELKPTDYLPKYHKSERKKFKVHQSIFLDIVENRIFDAYIDNNKHVQCNQFKFMTDIEIDFNELKKHFPPKQDDTNTKKRPMRALFYLGWGSWIRTNTDGVRVRSSTVKLCPNAPAII